MTPPNSSRAAHAATVTCAQKSVACAPSGSWLRRGPRLALVVMLVATGWLAGCASGVKASGPLAASRSYSPPEAQLGELAALYNCNQREVVVGRVGHLARVTAGADQVDLLPVAGTSGSRFAADGVGGSQVTQLHLHEAGMQIQWAGQDLGNCRLIQWLPATLDAQGYALGHVPGWQFHMDAHGARMAWDAQGTQPASVETIKLGNRQNLALGQPFAFGDAVVSSSVLVTHEVCVDGRSEWPRPFRVEVRRDGQTLLGCGGNPLSLLQSKSWMYQPNPGTPHFATLQFNPAGHLVGESGCNRFQAGYRMDGLFLKLQTPLSTRKSCLGGAMAFEKDFMEWLPKVSRFQLSEAGALMLLTADGRSFALR